MTHFIDPEDYDATVHRDIIDSLTRQFDPGYLRRPGHRRDEIIPVRPL